MTKLKVSLGLCLLFLLVLNLAFAELAQKKENEKNVTNPVTPRSAPASFILVTGVLNGFGGQRFNDAGYLSIFSGAQSSPIGSGSSTNYRLYAGFVQTTQVKCGDSNGDGSLAVADVVYLVNYLFKGGPMPEPYEAGEANCDGKVTVSDVVYLVNYLFKGGPVPIC